MPALAKEDRAKVMHVVLQIMEGYSLMGTDALEAMGQSLMAGNAVHINMEPDTRKETRKLFEALSAGGMITINLQDMFWSNYYGSCTDPFGVHWMFTCSEANKELPYKKGQGR